MNININKKEILKIIGLVVLIIAVPVTFYLVKNQQIFRSRADFQNSYELVDASGQPLPSFQDGYQTTTSSVTLNVTSINVSPSPSPSSSPAASNSPGSSPSASPSPSGNGATMYGVSFDSGFPQGQTYQGNLGANNQVTIDIVLPGGSGLKTAYLQFSDDGGNSWYPSTPQTAQVNLLSNATPSPIPSPATSASPSPAPGSPSPSPQAFKRVFVTSTIYDGNLGGLAGADLKCQTAANAERLNGIWKAWLSDMDISAADRLQHAEVPYKLLNDVVVANSWTDLTDGAILTPISITEKNTEVSGSPPQDGIPVWTQTLTGGAKRQSGVFCNNWRSGIVVDSPLIGNARSMNNWWTAWGSSFRCQDVSHLYCFEQ